MQKNAILQEKSCWANIELFLCHTSGKYFTAIIKGVEDKWQTLPGSLFFFKVFFLWYLPANLATTSLAAWFLAMKARTTRRNQEIKQTAAPAVNEIICIFPLFLLRFPQVKTFIRVNRRKNEALVFSLQTESVIPKFEVLFILFYPPKSFWQKLTRKHTYKRLPG